MFPHNRYRRLRTGESIRSLVRETQITPNEFIVPLFVVEGEGVKEAILSMPDYYRYSLDVLKKEVKVLWNLGLKSVLLFVKVDDTLKDNTASEALNADGLMQRATQVDTETSPQTAVMTDVALDPSASLGHDGIVRGGEIIDDATNAVLAEMSVSHAQAGADFVAASDM